jgi:hypothetical protein
MYILHRGDVEVIIGGTTVSTLSDGAVFGEIAVPLAEVEATGGQFAKDRFCFKVVKKSTRCSGMESIPL